MLKLLGNEEDTSKDRESNCITSISATRKVQNSAGFRLANSAAASESSWG
jgi:hypothetical protein